MKWKWREKKDSLFFDQNDDKTYECGQKAQISMLSDCVWCVTLNTGRIYPAWMENKFCRLKKPLRMSNNKQSQRHIMMSICLCIPSFFHPECFDFDCLFTNQQPHNCVLFSICSMYKDMQYRSTCWCVSIGIWNALCELWTCSKCKIHAINGLGYALCIYCKFHHSYGYVRMQ